MVKVLNIKISSHEWSKSLKSKDKNLKECLNIVSESKLLSVLPKGESHTVRFTLDNANSQLANAIRRVLMDEIPTYCLSFNEYTDIKTDDYYIHGQCDQLCVQINALRIDQDINEDEFSKWKIYLKKHNNTDDLMDITSGDIQIMAGNKQITDLFYPGYILSRLRNKCSLKIENIKIEKGLGLTNSNKFKYLANVYYEIMEEPLLETKDGFEGKSSLESDCKKFTIGYTTFKNIKDPCTPMFKCCDELKHRLDSILYDWENDINDKIHIRQEDSIYLIEIEGEKLTIGNLIGYYIYLEMPSIEYITSGIVHIEKNIAIIKIGNKNYKKLFSNAIKQALTDISIIRKDIAKVNHK